MIYHLKMKFVLILQIIILPYTKQSSLLAGSGGEVILTINSVILNMPCYPVSLNDSLSIDYTSQTVPYRTEPYINYSNSGPRTVSVAFNLHREMTNSNGSDIDNIINVIQAASYPTVGDSNAIPTSLKVGIEFLDPILVTEIAPVIDDNLIASSKL